jgi:alpha-L-rhamnosidase
MFRRAQFIWSTKQEIDAGGLFRAFLGGPSRRDDGPNRWFLFRRTFDLPARADEARLSVTVDGRYQLFVNGARIGRGPARCDPLHQRVDTYDVAPQLQPGGNVIALLVHVYGVDTAWYETVKGLWQPVFGDGAIYCDASVRCGDVVLDVSSDEYWHCLECAAWERDTPRVNWGLGFIELHDARAMPEGWTQPGFDDSAWDSVQVLSVGGGPPDDPFGGMKIAPFPTLLPREIPFLEESPVAPQRVVRWYGTMPQPDLPVDRRLYEEALLPLPAGCVEDPDALLAPNDDATVVRTTPELDVSVLLDFGRIHSGHPFIEIDAAGGEVIEVAVAEGIAGDWTTEKPASPRLSSEMAHGAHLFRYVARPGRQRFERFEWSAVRYAQSPCAMRRAACVFVTSARPSRAIRSPSAGTSNAPTLHSLVYGMLASTRCGCACTTAGRIARAASNASGWATRPWSFWSARPPSERASTR